MPEETKTTVTKTKKVTRTARQIATQWQPGQSGNPGGKHQWRKAIQDVVGDGSKLFEHLHALATGQVIKLKDADGKQAKHPVTRKNLVIVPTADVMLRATHELLDRAFGRAVQAIQLTGGDEVGLKPDMIMTTEESVEVKRITRNILARAAGKLELQPEPETIEAESSREPDDDAVADAMEDAEREEWERRRASQAEHEDDQAKEDPDA